MIVMKGFQLGGLDMSGSRDHWSVQTGLESWPVLLVLIDSDPRLAEPIAALLRDTFRGPRGDVVAGYLAGWIRAGQEDQACLAALLRFIPYLVADTTDAARLKHVVARMPHDWARTVGSGRRGHSHGGHQSQGNPGEQPMDNPDRVTTAQQPTTTAPPRRDNGTVGDVARRRDRPPYRRAIHNRKPNRTSRKKTTRSSTNSARAT